MSYDIRFAVKAENGAFVVFHTPEYDTPTYNVGTIFRKAMDFDFKQGEFYRVSELIPHLIKGANEVLYHKDKYIQYEPDNGWGSVDTVRTALMSILDAIEYIKEWHGIPLEYFYMAW